MSKKGSAKHNPKRKRPRAQRVTIPKAKEKRSRSKLFEFFSWLIPVFVIFSASRFCFNWLPHWLPVMTIKTNAAIFGFQGIWFAYWVYQEFQANLKNAYQGMLVILVPTMLIVLGQLLLNWPKTITGIGGILTAICLIVIIFAQQSKN